MTSTPLDLIGRSAAYTAGFTHGDLEAPPAAHLAVLTCMDARIVPHALLDLDVGDAHVMRNAGGRATDDAVRSLVVSSRLLGVRQIAVIHHTRCGNAGTDEDVAGKLRDAGVEDPPTPLHANGPTALEDDVRRLREDPRLAEGCVVEGFTYDVTTGELRAM